MKTRASVSVVRPRGGDGRTEGADERGHTNEFSRTRSNACARSLAIPTSFQLPHCIKHNPYRESNLRTDHRQPQLHALHTVGHGGGGLPLLITLDLDQEYEVSPSTGAGGGGVSFALLYSTFEFNPSAPPLACPACLIPFRFPYIHIAAAFLRCSEWAHSLPLSVARRPAAAVAGRPTGEGSDGGGLFVCLMCGPRPLARPLALPTMSEWSSGSAASSPLKLKLQRSRPAGRKAGRQSVDGSSRIEWT